MSVLADSCPATKERKQEQQAEKKETSCRVVEGDRSSLDSVDETMKFDHSLQVY